MCRQIEAVFLLTSKLDKTSAAFVVVSFSFYFSLLHFIFYFPKMIDRAPISSKANTGIRK